MAGTKAGGIKAAATNKAKYSRAFYMMIGSKGGKKTGMKGFALDREHAQRCGAIGGKLSHRGKAVRKVSAAGGF